MPARTQSHRDSVGAQDGAAAAEDSVAVFLTQLNIILPCGPAVVLLGVYPKELETYVHVKSWLHSG